MLRTKSNKTYSRIVSGLLICSTVLGIMSPTASTLADDTNNTQNNVNNERVDYSNTPANKAGQNKMAGLSSMSRDLNKPVQKDQNATQNKSNHLNNSEQSHQNASDRTNARVQQTGQVTAIFEYNGTPVGEQSINAPVGQTVNLGDHLPSALQKNYRVAPYMFKVASQAPASALVNVTSTDTPQRNDENVLSDITDRLNSDPQLLNKFTHDRNLQKLFNSIEPASRVNKQMSPVTNRDATPLPSAQSAHTRKRVVNPMLRPDNAPRYQNASQVKSEVPMTTKDSPRDLKNVKPFKDFSKGVLQYKPYLDKVCEHYHMKSHESLLLAIMQVETGGHGSDVMQSSESLGLQPNSLNPQQSIEQGTRYMAKIVKKAKKMDKAERRNKHMKRKDYHYYANDNRLLAQTYNYGGNFLDYVSRQKSGYNLKVAQRYSRDVVAPLLGNDNGTTYHYDNPISRMYHQQYLYTNGGNYFYGDMTEQYAVGGGYMGQILNHLIKYSGQKYVMNGKNPEEGFNSSGLVSYGFKKLGVKMPANTVSQWHRTKRVRNGIKKAQPGDLVFFKTKYGHTKFLTHVGYVVDRHTMFSSDGSGVGFHNLDTPYWKAHFAGVRRVPQAKKLNAKAEAQLNKDTDQAVGIDDSENNLSATFTGESTFSGHHYTPNNVPNKLKKYIHSPKKVGMHYGSSQGWDDQAVISNDQCTGFSNSFFPAIWHTSKRNAMGNGIDMVDVWSQKMKGHVSNTPHAGAIASSSNPALTGDDSAGHTFVVEHVFKNGDVLVAEQNWPSVSGADAGMTNTWDFAVLPQSIVSNNTQFFMPDTHAYHLNWK